MWYKIVHNAAAAAAAADDDDNTALCSFHNKILNRLSLFTQ
jgi:hypothetical protein